MAPSKQHCSRLKMAAYRPGLELLESRRPPGALWLELDWSWVFGLRDLAEAADHATVPPALVSRESSTTPETTPESMLGGAGQESAGGSTAHDPARFGLELSSPWPGSLETHSDVLEVAAAAAGNGPAGETPLAPEHNGAVSGACAPTGGCFSCGAPAPAAGCSMGCCCITAGLVVPSSAPDIHPITVSSGPLQVRQDQADLTQREIQDFVTALKVLKTTYRGTSEISVYDEYVAAHIYSMSVMASHGASAFLPWHRAYLRSFELELQRINPQVTIPYWDMTDDLTGPRTLFAEDFMGGTGDEEDGYIVHSGPFRAGEWPLAHGGPWLTRNFGQWGLTTLPTLEHVQAALQIRQYDTAPWNTDANVQQSFRNFLEGWNHPSGRSELHNRVHEWVGGSMLGAASPNDPLFWLLHSNIDRIWGQWQDQTGGEYVPVTGGPPGHNLYDQMAVVGVRPVDVLDHRELGYEYAD